MGNTKKKKRPRKEQELVGGLKKGAGTHEDDEYVLAYSAYTIQKQLIYCAFHSDDEDKNAKTRRVVRANNFTQQTNALDVDKHMYACPPSGIHSSP